MKAIFQVEEYKKPMKCINNCCKSKEFLLIEESVDTEMIQIQKIRYKSKEN